MKTIGKKGIWLGTLAAACALAGACLTAGTRDGSAAAEASDLYWSEKNAPVLYGATKITLAKNAVETFSVQDARFRTFAHDFEDGDLKLTCLSNDVKPSLPGSYTVKYYAVDSDRNGTSLTVPVEVTEEENGMIAVERTLYTVPSDWNLTAAGFSRCDTGDRQILGIYLPAGASFEMRLMEGAPKLTVAMLNNDSYKETALTLSSQDFTTVTNNCTADDPAAGKVPGNYANVPLLSSPRLSRGEPISTTYRYEIRYRAEEVHPLCYYHVFDEDEAGFRNSWKESGDLFAVLENEAMTILLPEGDREAYARKEGGFVFSGYNEHLEYYRKVIERMDKMVGLSFRPEDPADQNLRAKYLVKANAHGAGAAYYAGNHVGINSASMGAFYQMNWGGLHELAHGYQGHLGNGTMGLGETSNNILGHYIQLDKTLYTYDGDWLGKLPDIEEKINEERRTGKTFNDFGSQPQYKLYALINLFDRFEGEDTYAKLFSYYRKNAIAGRFSSKTPQQDVYALFFAEEYGANIIPYWNQWGLETSEDVQTAVAGMAKETFSILTDSAGDCAGALMEGEHISLKYGLVTDGQLRKYGAAGDLEVTFEIDDPSVLDKGGVLLEREGELAASAEISDGKAVFRGLAAGSYIMRTPVDFDYESRDGFITVSAGMNTVKAVYTGRVSFDEHPVTLRITGPNRTDGFLIEMSEKNTRAHLVFGAADLGNQGSAWKADPQVYIGVRFLSGGRTVNEWLIHGGEFFCYTENRIPEAAFSYGDVIEIETWAPQYVQVISALDKKEIEAYRCPLSGKQTLRFTVTEEGLLPDYAEFSVKETLYAHVRETLLEKARGQAEYFETHGEALGVKYEEKGKKAEFIESYSRLSAEDRGEFAALAEQILKGAAPTVRALKDSLTAETFGDIDWDSCFEAYDAEDGKIVYGDKVSVLSEGENKKSGTYTAQIVVTDFDGNRASCTVEITLGREDTRMVWETVAIVGGAALIVVTAGLFVFFVLRRGHKRR